MPETTSLKELNINILTKAQYNSATKDPNQLYLITDETGNEIIIDSALSSTSTNPVQNKVINEALNSKQNTISGGASTITGSNLTTNRVLVSNGSGKVAVSDITSTELGYLDGVTSNVQTQLNNKAASTQGVYYATSSTGASTQTKTATVSSGTFTLVTGARVTVKFSNANSNTSPSLNVGSTGAKSIYWHGATIPSSQYWEAGAVVDFVYNGSQWELIGIAKDNSGEDYTLPTASSSTLGGIKVGSNLSISNGVLSANMPTSVATLSTARTIDGIQFDGSANVTRYASSTTGATTAAKTASVTAGTFSLATGARVSVKFSNAHTGTSAPTLNINSSGAKTIRWRGATITSDQYWAAGQVVDFVYDGTYWNMIGAANDNAGGDYTLPNASSSTLGGVKIGSNISVSNGVISLTASNVTTALGYTPARGISYGTSLPSTGNNGDVFILLS